MATAPTGSVATSAKGATSCGAVGWRALRVLQAIAIVALVPVLAMWVTWLPPAPLPAATFTPDQLWFLLTLLISDLTMHASSFGLLIPLTPAGLSVWPVMTNRTVTLVFVVRACLQIVLVAVIPWAIGDFPVPFLLMAVSTNLWGVAINGTVVKFANHMYAYPHGVALPKLMDKRVLSAFAPEAAAEVPAATRPAPAAQGDGGGVAAIASAAVARGPEKPQDRVVETDDTTSAAVNPLADEQGGGSSEAQAAALKSAASVARARTILVIAGFFGAYGVMVMLLAVYMVAFVMVAAGDPTIQALIVVISFLLQSGLRMFIVGFFVRRGFALGLISPQGRHMFTAVQICFLEMFQMLVFPAVDSLAVFWLMQVVDAMSMFMAVLFLWPALWSRVEPVWSKTLRRFDDWYAAKLDAQIAAAAKAKAALCGGRSSGGDEAAAAGDDGDAPPLSPAQSRKWFRSDRRIGATAGSDGGTPRARGSVTSPRAAPRAAHGAATADGIDVAPTTPKASLRLSPAAADHAVASRDDHEPRAGGAALAVAPASVTPGAVSVHTDLEAATGHGSGKPAARRAGDEGQSRRSRLLGRIAKVHHWYRHETAVVDKCVELWFLFLAELLATAAFVGLFVLARASPVAKLFPYDGVPLAQTLTFAGVSLGVQSGLFIVCFVIANAKFGVDCIAVGHSVMAADPRIAWALAGIVAGGLKLADVQLMSRYSGALSWLVDTGRLNWNAGDVPTA